MAQANSSPTLERWEHRSVLDLGFFLPLSSVYPLGSVPRLFHQFLLSFVDTIHAINRRLSTHSLQMTQVHQSSYPFSQSLSLSLSLSLSRSISLSISVSVFLSLRLPYYSFVCPD